jgi:hypothetical protein
MPMGILFWVIYIVALLAAGWAYYEPAQPMWFRRAGGYFVLWLLVGILGWQVFGPAVK